MLEERKRTNETVAERHQGVSVTRHLKSKSDGAVENRITSKVNTCEFELSRSVSGDSLVVVIASLIPEGDGEQRLTANGIYTFSFALAPAHLAMQVTAKVALAHCSELVSWPGARRRLIEKHSECSISIETLHRSYVRSSLRVTRELTIVCCAVIDIPGW